VKILVADDDPVSLRMMERMLGQSSYEVVAIEDGREAVHELPKPTTSAGIDRLDGA
jgi:CheY-like chemotaxis protein